MIPFGTNKVTLFHKSEGRVTRHYLTGCSWKEVRERSLIDGQMERKTSTSCICRYSHTQQKGAAGDVYVLGHVNDTVERSTDFARVLEKYKDTGAFMCEAFNDNSIGAAPLKHFCAKGA